MIGQIFLSIGLLILAVIIIMLIKTALTRTRQLDPIPKTDISIDSMLVCKHLSEALQFKTVSSETPDKFQYTEFDKFYRYLGNTYPKLHSQLKKIVIGGYSLLYEWTGKDSSAAPVIIMAHTDVVPVSPDTEKDWKYPAFSGAISEGYIWGRGATDCKGNVMGICEAVEYLVGTGYQPSRTIYLAFGHDEEVMGLNGALQIAAHLKSKGIKAMCVLDEGGAIVKGVIPGLNKPVGMIGSSEKGYVNIELTAKAEGGHSSTPQRETAIGILCNAVAKLEKHPFPTKFKGPAKDMFSFVTAEMGFKYRFLFSNLWLFNGLIKRFMLSSPVTAASIRTTSVATIINGGFKANVLPDTAKAIINVRILPGDNFEGIVKHMEKIISDRRISVKQIGNKSDKLSISSTDSLCFKTIQKTIKQVFPEALASPYQVLGATDSRYYSDVSADIFRFGPLNIHVSDLKMNHGVNERISIDNFIKTVEFYILFITNIQDSLSRGNV